jgi:hypothetical protein
MLTVCATDNVLGLGAVDIRGVQLTAETAVLDAEWSTSGLLNEATSTIEGCMYALEALILMHQAGDTRVYRNLHIVGLAQCVLLKGVDTLLVKRSVAPVSRYSVSCMSQLLN